MVQSNDDVRWLIVREIPHLRRFARTLTGGAAAADDLVQDSLERALRKSHTWRREGHVRSWLFKIMYSVFLNRHAPQVKKQNRQVEIDDDMGAVAVLHPRQESQFHYKEVMRNLESLPHDQKDILLLVAMEGFSYDQVAKIMDIPVGTVRSRLSRARDALRGKLKMPADTGSKVRSIR